MTQKEFEKKSAKLPRLEKKMQSANIAFEFVDKYGVWFKSAGMLSLIPTFLFTTSMPLLAGALLAVALVLTIGTTVAKFIMQDNVELRKEEYQNCYYEVLNYRPQAEQIKEQIDKRVINKIKTIKLNKQNDVEKTNDIGINT